jgi:GNAT superfamily N-acetyltransferase
LRSCTEEERKARNLPRILSASGGKQCAYFEIHRLFVNPTYRCQGIATALVESCENFVTSKTKKRSADTAMVLVAMTPAILDGANHFYNVRGFVEHQEVIVKHLLMTYQKVVKQNAALGGGVYLTSAKSSFE